MLPPNLPLPLYPIRCLPLKARSRGVKAHDIVRTTSAFKEPQEPPTIKKSNVRTIGRGIDTPSSLQIERKHVHGTPCADLSCPSLLWVLRCVVWWGSLRGHGDRAPYPSSFEVWPSTVPLRNGSCILLCIYRVTQQAMMVCACSRVVCSSFIMDPK